MDGRIKDGTGGVGGNNGQKEIYGARMDCTPRAHTDGKNLPPRAVSLLTYESSWYSLSLGLFVAGCYLKVR